MPRRKDEEDGWEEGRKNRWKNVLWISGRTERRTDRQRGIYRQMKQERMDAETGTGRNRPIIGWMQKNMEEIRDGVKGEDRK